MAFHNCLPSLGVVREIVNEVSVRFDFIMLWEGGSGVYLYSVQGERVQEVQSSLVEVMHNATCLIL